ncbi:TIGR02530 family flagellar biosynthesis protein [Clostridium rectalis]|uniref:TIGR02530 family flagellar biosynthesis protein n=1 Tax=Clostridium rectalis TaxID=2040295 RepID=UPI000F630B2A|nr:TIGR02530 family flagellar biosynthesis protein [Clostridium rectalis]
MGYRVINGKIQFLGQFDCNYSNNKTKITQNTDKNNFSNVLKKEINKENSFVISNHALDRLRERNVSFNQNDMKNINNAINKAVNKNCKESVILYKDIALVTSIKNRTIITAVNKNEGKDNVFTNIDSLVII